eukprot:6175190-Pleurochrysis_carterae.AAC.4
MLPDALKTSAYGDNTERAPADLAMSGTRPRRTSDLQPVLGPSVFHQPRQKHQKRNDGNDSKAKHLATIVIPQKLRHSGKATYSPLRRWGEC